MPPPIIEVTQEAARLDGVAIRPEMGRRQPVHEGAARDGEEFLARELRGFRVRIGSGNFASGAGCALVQPANHATVRPTGANRYHAQSLPGPTFPRHFVPGNSSVAAS